MTARRSRSPIQRATSGQVERKVFAPMNEPICPPSASFFMISPRGADEFFGIEDLLRRRDVIVRAGKQEHQNPDFLQRQRATQAYELAFARRFS
jgi:hypothetical protein